MIKIVMKTIKNLSDFSASSAEAAFVIWLIRIFR